MRFNTLFDFLKSETPPFAGQHNGPSEDCSRRQGRGRGTGTGTASGINQAKGTLTMKPRIKISVDMQTTSLVMKERGAHVVASVTCDTHSDPESQSNKELAMATACLNAQSMRNSTVLQGRIFPHSQLASQLSYTNKGNEARLAGLMSVSHKINELNRVKNETEPRQ